MKRISFILALLVIGCSQAYAAGLIGIIRTSKALQKLEERVRQQQQGTVTSPPAPANHGPEITFFAPTGENVSPENVSISWLVTDPDGDAVTSNLWFGTSALNLIGQNLTTNSYYIGNLNWATTYQVKLECCDSKGSSTSREWSFTTAPIPNNPPTIFSLVANPSTVLPEETSTITCVASDSDGDTLTYSYSATGGVIVGSGFEVVWIAPTEGQYTIICVVSDGKSASQGSVTVTVVGPNQPPVITSLTVSPSTIYRNQVATVTCQASDPDGDTLEYVWSCDAGTLLIQGTPGPIVQWQAPSEGTYTITCKVRDVKGGVDEKSVNIAVVVQTIFHLAGKAKRVSGGEIYFDNVLYNSETGSITGYAWSPTMGTISFQPEDLQDVPWAGPYGTITYCRIRPDGKGIGWGKFITQPEEGYPKESLMSVSSDSTGGQIQYGITLDFTTGRFDGWAWDTRWNGSYISWGKYYGEEWGVYIKDWTP